MSNNKFDATFFDPKSRESYAKAKPSGRFRRPEHAKRLPLPAKIGAGAVVLLALVVLPVSCIATAAREGAAYDACVQKIAQEQGHEAAVYEVANGACRD